MGSGEGGTPGVVAVVEATHATLVLLGYLVALAVLAGAVHARRDIA